MFFILQKQIVLYLIHHLNLLSVFSASLQGPSFCCDLFLVFSIHVLFRYVRPFSTKL